ncbi:MAG: DMT family transporter [Bacteroidales bacterium]|nr:DMT family transporter [Bacteroidales bacterium]
MYGFVGLLLAVLVVGALTPVQTAVNSRLQHGLGSPLAASLVSFTVGTAVTALVCLFAVDSFRLVSAPWYAWTGGIFGVIGVTLFIVLFPRIGGIQTVLLPILGQIVAGMLTDSLGLFGTVPIALSVTRIAGALVAMAGVFMVVLKPSGDKGASLDRLPWWLLGFLAGAFIAFQSAANGTLGHSLGSPFLASLVSFVFSTLILCLLVLFSREDRSAAGRIFKVKVPWWAWTGGLIGSCIVIGYTVAAPVLGVGFMSVVSILGQLAASTAIDRFGLLCASKVKVTPLQYAGIATVLAGSILIYV